MNNMTRTALLLAPLMLAACGKKTPEAAPAAVVVAAPAPVAPAAPAAPVAKAEPTDAERELADKQAKLAYGTMEDRYINDPRAQWAATANASSVYQDPKPLDSNLPKNVIGPIDGQNWCNASPDMGFDTLELGYTKPVAATEVRLIIENGEGVESISKVELQDENGKWNVIWSGISDVKRDLNGKRTWFVRSFEKTAYKVKGVKYTFANNVQVGYKYADAAQLVGD